MKLSDRITDDILIEAEAQQLLEDLKSRKQISKMEQMILNSQQPLEAAKMIIIQNRTITHRDK